MMNLPMFPKPGQVKKVHDPIKVFADGREVCNQLTKAGRDEYRGRTLTMWDRQGRRCALQITTICKQRQGRWPQDEVQFDHELGRGFSGGKRDDRIEIGGKPVSGAVCPYCNVAKGSRRVAYIVDVP